MSAAAMPELAAWVRLNGACAWGPDRLRSLAGRLGIERLASASAEELAEAGGLGLEPARRLREMLARCEPRREIERALDLGLRVVAWDAADFPEALKSTADAPLVLYAWGRLEPGRDALAFVGSRQPTPYGRRMTRFLVREAASSLVIVSGLARGIDTEAHRAALDAGGCTWAVLGSGLGKIYPPENAALAHEIAASGGCLLSEFPLDTEPLPGNFPLRNRIVSGLSWGAVVVEGRDKSGSLITARLAAEQGRAVFAVPGPADSPLSVAPLRLLSQGAVLARSMADIWPELPPECQARVKAIQQTTERMAPPTACPPPAGGRAGFGAVGAEPRITEGMVPPTACITEHTAPLTACLPPAGGRAGFGAFGAEPYLLPQAHKKILELLGCETRSLDELGRESGLGLPSLAQTLIEMEIQDLIESVPGQRYAKKNV